MLTNGTCYLDNENRDTIKFPEPLQDSYVETPSPCIVPPTSIFLPGARNQNVSAKPPPTMPKPAYPDRNKRMPMNIPDESEREKISDVPVSHKFNRDREETSCDDPISSSEDFKASRTMAAGSSGSLPMKKPPVPLPSAALRQVSVGASSEPTLVALDTMLPARCMFLESDQLIHDYRRRDARTITFSKIKPALPAMTTKEINILERYAKT